MKNKINGMLGIATAAGRIAFGDTAVRDAIFRRKATLVIFASDCGENTREKIKKLCLEKGVPTAVYSDKITIGKAVGKEGKAVIAVTDRGFGEAIFKLLSAVINEKEE